MNEKTMLPPVEPDSPQKYCGNCGAPIPPKRYFCEVCLAPASLAVTTPPKPAAAEPPPDAPADKPAPPPDAPADKPAPLPSAAPVIPLPSGKPASPLPDAGPAAAPAMSPPPPPPSPPARRGWWLVLMIGGLIMAAVPLFFACIMILFANEMDSPDISAGEFRAIGTFCCLLPGLLFGSAAAFGGYRYFRRST